VMDAFHAACARIVLTFDGFLAEFRGDGIIAYFGYPRAHEDDAERTVRAGLVSTGGIGFGLPALRPDDSYALFGIGASTDLGQRLVGFASINATAAKNDGNYQAVTVGVRLPL